MKHWQKKTANNQRLYVISVSISLDESRTQHLVIFQIWSGAQGLGLVPERPSAILIILNWIPPCLVPWESRPALKTTVTPPKKTHLICDPAVATFNDCGRACVWLHTKCMYVIGCVCSCIFAWKTEMICEKDLSDPVLMCFSRFQQVKCVWSFFRVWQLPLCGASCS